MIKWSIVIFFFSVQAIANSSGWSHKIIESQNKKTIAQVCKKTSERIQKKICKPLKKAELEEAKKIKWTLEDRMTARLRFLDNEIKIRKTDEPSTYLVNRKSLYLEEIESFPDLKKKLMKLSGVNDSLVISAALLMLYQNSEHQSCQVAEELVQNCLKIKDLQSPDIEKTKHQKTFQQFVSKAAKLDLLNNYFSPSKKDGLNQCVCVNNFCGTDPKASIAKNYKSCLKDIRSLAKRVKRDKIENEGFTQFISTFANLEKKVRPRSPALFKEDSFKD